MGLSNNIENILDQNYKAIVNDVPFLDILVDLRIESVLSDAEVTQLRQCGDNRYAGFEFVKILKSRSDAEFFKFCKVLKDTTIENVQCLGRTLENSAGDRSQAQGELYSYVLLRFDYTLAILHFGFQNDVCKYFLNNFYMANNELKLHNDC